MTSRSTAPANEPRPWFLQSPADASAIDLTKPLVDFWRTAADNIDIAARSSAAASRAARSSGVGADDLVQFESHAQLGAAVVWATVRLLRIVRVWTQRPDVAGYVGSISLASLEPPVVRRAVDRVEIGVESAIAQDGPGQLHADVVDVLDSGPSTEHPAAGEHRPMVLDDEIFVSLERLVEVPEEPFALLTHAADSSAKGRAVAQRLREAFEREQSLVESDDVSARIVEHGLDAPEDVPSLFAQRAGVAALVAQWQGIVAPFDSYRRGRALAEITNRSPRDVAARCRLGLALDSAVTNPVVAERLPALVAHSDVPVAASRARSLRLTAHLVARLIGRSLRTWSDEPLSPSFVDSLLRPFAAERDRLAPPAASPMPVLVDAAAVRVMVEAADVIAPDTIELRRRESADVLMAIAHPSDDASEARALRMLAGAALAEAVAVRRQPPAQLVEAQVFAPQTVNANLADRLTRLRSSFDSAVETAAEAQQRLLTELAGVVRALDRRAPSLLAGASATNAVVLLARSDEPSEVEPPSVLTLRFGEAPSLTALAERLVDERVLVRSGAGSAGKLVAGAVVASLVGDEPACAALVAAAEQGLEANGRGWFPASELDELHRALEAIAIENPDHGGDFVLRLAKEVSPSARGVVPVNAVQAARSGATPTGATSTSPLVIRGASSNALDRDESPEILLNRTIEPSRPDGASGPSANPQQKGPSSGKEA